MPKISSNMQQTLAYALALIVMKGVSLVLIPFITGKLSPAEYGTLEVLTVFADVASIVLGFGLVDALYRYAGPADDEPSRRSIAANGFGLAMVTGVFFGLLLQLFAEPLAGLLPAEIDVLDFRLIAFTLALEGAIAIPMAWIRMQNRAWSFLAVSGGKAVVQAGLAIYLLEEGYGITGVLAAGAIAAGLMAAYLCVDQLVSTGIGVQWSWVRKMMIYGSPLIIGGLANFVLGSFDRWILADSVGTADMAQYALAGKFALVAALLIQPFGMWWYPKRFAMLKEDNGIEDSARIAAMGTTLGIAAAAGIGIAGPIAIRVLTPETYHSATLYVPWLVAAVALQNAGNLLNVGCYTGHSGKLPMKLNVASAVVAFIGYLALIPFMGIWGAVAATIGAYIVRTWLFVHYSQRELHLPYPYRGMLILTLLSMVVLGLSQISLGEIWLDIAYGLVLMVVLVGVGLLTKALPAPSVFLNR